MTIALRAGRPLALAAVAWLAITGCTGEPAVDDDPAKVTTTTQPAPPEPAAGDLRLDLERGFALRAHLSTELIRVRGRRLAAADQALRDNTAALASLVADAYDRPTGDEFADTLDTVSQRLTAYRRVVSRSPRPAAVQNARQRLRRSAADTGRFMSRTTGGGLERQGTSALLRAAVLDLADHVDAYVGEDFDQAYVMEREAYAAMTAVGRAFAAGISEHNREQFPGPRRSGVIELRSAMAQLLGEHSGLAVTVMRRGAAGGRDFEAAAAALNGNTDDLLAALETIYPEAVGPFGSAWRDQISHLADYAAGAAQDQTARRRAARAGLGSAIEEAASVLEEASDAIIDAAAFEEALREHTAALRAQIDAYVNGDLGDAERLRRTAFDAAADVSDLVSAGIAEHRPEDFPGR